MVGKGNIPWNKGKKLPQISGENHPMYGKKHSKETRKKISETLKKNPVRYWLGKKRPNSSKRMIMNNPMHNPEIVKKVHKKMDWKTRERFKDKKFREEWIIKMRESQKNKPNKPEKKVIEIIKENNLPYRYVGDGQVWMKNDGSSFNPDFIHINRKVIIEVFGTYWHNREDAKMRDKYRLIAYKKYGYTTLVIWEHELKNKEKVLNKINEFM